MAHSYPDFLIVGMMKAGTTSIHRHLADHPHVLEPLEKELHYFTRDFNVWVPESAWHLEYGEQLGLEGCQPRPGFLTGEASPSYIAIPQRIHAFNPNCKIIISLRDPVERAISQLRQYHLYEYGTVEEGFARHFAEQEDISKLDAVIDSNYVRRLRWWFDAFPHEQIALVSFEAFRREPQLVMNRLYRWLGLDVRLIDAEYVGAPTEVQYDEDLIRARLEEHVGPMRGQVAAEIADKNVFLVPADPAEFSNY